MNPIVVDVMKVNIGFDIVSSVPRMWRGSSSVENVVVKVGNVESQPTQPTQVAEPQADFAPWFDHSQFVEWDDTNTHEIPRLFGDWSLLPTTLQQTWTLLLVNVLLVNDDETLQGKVVETFGRSRGRDCFGERPSEENSLPTPHGHRYQHIKVCRLTDSHKVKFITLGTKCMNAIFTQVVHKKGNETSVKFGLSSGKSFNALASTRVFLSKRSIQEAREHEGNRFAEVFLSRYQLRSIFSHFGEKSAYFSARAAPPELREVPAMMPATIFTLADFLDR
jgi:hypothetical protein